MRTLLLFLSNSTSHNKLTSWVFHMIDDAVSVSTDERSWKKYCLLLILCKNGIIHNIVSDNRLLCQNSTIVILKIFRVVYSALSDGLHLEFNIYTVRNDRINQGCKGMVTSRICLLSGTDWLYYWSKYIKSYELSTFLQATTCWLTPSSSFY